MEMYIDINLDRIVAKINLPQGRNDNILAFGALWIYQKDNPEPIFKIKGFTIRQQIAKETNTSFMKIVFPAYRAGPNFITSFIIQNEELLKKTRELLQEEYHQQTGDNPYRNPEPEVDPDDIPF